MVVTSPSFTQLLVGYLPQFSVLFVAHRHAIAETILDIDGHPLRFALFRSIGTEGGEKLLFEDILAIKTTLPKFFFPILTLSIDESEAWKQQWKNATHSSPHISSSSFSFSSSLEKMVALRADPALLPTTPNIKPPGNKGRPKKFSGEENEETASKRVRTTETKERPIRAFSDDEAPNPLGFEGSSGYVALSPNSPASMIPTLHSNSETCQVSLEHSKRMPTQPDEACHLSDGPVESENGENLQGREMITPTQPNESEAYGENFMNCCLIEGIDIGRIHLHSEV